MLPTHSAPARDGGSTPPVCFPRLAAAAAAGRPSFLSSFCHRMGHLSLMDLQFSLAQFSLLLFAPRKVYAFAVLRKKQKNHYARDDPGFLLLLLLFSLLVGLAYGLAFSHSLCGCLLTSLAPSIYVLLSGTVIAPLAYVMLLRLGNRDTGAITIYRTVIKNIFSLTAGRRNCKSSESCTSRQEPMAARRDVYAQQQQPTRYFPLRLQQNAPDVAGVTTAAGLEAASAVQRGDGKVDHGREKSADYLSYGGPAVELFFCFDVHWNASFVYMVVGLVMQLFLFPVFTMLPDFLSCVLANSVQFAALGSYLFITILGYVSVLPTRQPPPFYSFLPAVALATTLVVIGTAFFYINLAHFSVKVMLLFESIALRPVVRNPGIAHTLLQQEVFEILSLMNNSLPAGASPSAIRDGVAPAIVKTAETETAGAASAALSAGSGVGDTAAHTGESLVQRLKLPSVAAFPTSGAELPAAGFSSGL